VDVERFRGLIGVVALLALCFAFSTHRRAIKARTVVWGLALQFLFAFFVLRVDFGRRLFERAGEAVTTFLGYSVAGSSFLFGDLGKKGPPFYIAFQVLPTIIFVAAFFAILYHWGVMQFLIRQMARTMTRFLGSSGAESMNVAASVFLGCTEAPLTIRPFLERLTRSELMTIMTSGMAHISGAVMAAYILFGIPAHHLLAAVIMTAPGTILIAKMLNPETEEPVTAGRVDLRADELETDRPVNLLGAIAKGTTDGLWLTLNVAAMLIAFLALIALANGLLGAAHEGIARLGWGGFPSSFEQIFGVVFAPVAWVIGIPWRDCRAIGDLLGTRLVLNEFVAYSRLGGMQGSLDARSFLVATYALCGFANLGTIGVELGGIGSLAPGKKAELARLGMRASSPGRWRT
jgi:concentrative nucleoside transporter, CNT family